MNFQSTVDRQPWRDDAREMVLRKRFLKAVLLSLALHISLLWYQPRMPSLARPAQPLMATLRAVEAPPPAEIFEPAPPSALPRPEPKARPAARPEVMRSPAVAERRQPAAPAVRPALPGPPEPDTQEQKSLPATPALEGSRAASTPAATAPPGEGLDPNSLRQYRVALASTASRFKVYPGLARERGWAGTADIRVTVFGDGRMPQVQVAKSSGYPILDNQAREMLLRATQNTPLPDNLRGRAFSEVLPVRFDLTAE